MKLKSMNTNAMMLLIAGTMLCAWSSCGPRNTEETKQDVTVIDSSSGKKVPNMRLTLPILDALFYEDGFADELKTKLGLSEDQMEKLKTISSASVKELSEEGPANYTGSERAAVEDARNKIREILGEDKANQLYQLIAVRYQSGDVEGMMSTTPNAVPKDTRIVVNTPAYRMDVYQDGRLIKSYKVGIGYPEFPLPAGMRRAEAIIFNPTWTPPNEPWVKGKFKPGETVSGSSKDNPLGPVKIPIGLPSLIHGGKNPAKLGSFASHGCVGLTNDMIQDFAATLAGISGSGLTLDSVKGMQQKGTSTYKLPKAVPVELRYETIVAQNGALHIYRDVYERGTNTLDAAKKVLQAHGVAWSQLSQPEQQQVTAALMQMNRDAQGKPIVADAGIPADSAQAATADELAEDRKKGVSGAKLDRSKANRVTRTVAGEKEQVVPIAALAGKGYPAPVNFETGGTKGIAAEGNRK